MKRKLTFFFILAIFSGIFVQNSFAQLTGIKTIPGDYATISAAITDLNTVGVGSGGVTFNISAGYTETAANLIITATGTFTNQIVFQKSGVGANPLITAGVGTGTLDGIIKLSGSDYITFNGIDLQESTGNTTTTTQMEWGFALLKVDGTNGSQFNTIKNCTISLNKANTASYGIYSANHTTASTTTLTVTATTGSNSGNQYFSNTIQNCYSGIWMGGFADATAPYAFYDHYNQIGVSGGNTIRYFGGGASTTYGIYTIYQDSLAISNNSISGGTGTTTTQYGIMISTATNASVLVYNNTVSDTTSTTTSSTYGIALSNAGVTGTDNTVIVKRNTVQGMTSTAATTAILYGYYIYYTTAINIYVDSNKFINNKWGGATQTATGTIYGFYIYPYTLTPVAGSMQYVTNNYMSGNKRTQSAVSTGTLYGMYIYYGNQTVNAYNNIIENDTLSTTTSASYYMYIYNYYASTVNYYNNAIRNVYKTNGSTGTLYGYYISNAAYAGTFNFYNNTVNNIKTAGAASASMYGIYNIATSVTKTMYGNTAYSMYGSVAGSVYGIYQSGGTTINTYKNSVYDLRTSTGYPYGMTIAGGTTNNVYNNFISDIRADSVNSTMALMGLYLSGGTTANVYYNTVYLNSVSHLTGQNFGTAAIYASTTPTVDLRNNIAVNMSTPGTLGGYTTAYYRSTSTLTSYSSLSNNNDFYSGVPDTNHIIYFDGTNYMRTMSDFKALVSPRDANSVTENPPFLNVATRPYNLHLNASVPTQCEAAGIIVSTPIAVNDDYDGNARYPNSGYPINPSYPPVAPDIGADEIGGIPVDMTPPNMVYTPLLNTPLTTARTLVATITDPSGVPTSGIGLPVLYFRKNSGSYTAVTSSSLGSNLYSFTFGSGASTGDTIYYYLAAQDNSSPINVGTSPSNGASGFTPNPPAASVPPTTLNKYIISQSPLSGDYTVGLLMFNKATGRNITFEKVTKKVMKEVVIDEPMQLKKDEKGNNKLNETDFNADKVTGKTKLVEVEEISWIPMDNGKVYTGDLYIKKSEYPNYSYPAGVNGIYATITAAVADLNLRGVGGNTRFLLNDATYPTETFPLTVNIANDNITSATKTVTFKPNTGVVSTIAGAAPSSRIFTIRNSYVTIDGSNTTNGTTRDLTIQNTSTTTPQVLLFGSTGTTPITNGTLKNCTVINGINSSSAVVVSDGAVSGTAGYFNNITIQNNSIQLAYIALYCNAVISSGNGNGLLITGNDLNTSGTNAVRLVGAYLQGVDGGTVSNNNFGNFTVTDASNVSGVWFATGTVNSTISGNTITNLVGAAIGAPRGIAVSSAYPNANINITGNTISNISCAYSAPPYGIYVFSTTSGVSIKKNKISGLLNTSASGYGARGINIATSVSPANIDIVNNFVWNLAATSDATVTYWGIGIAIDATINTVNVYFNSVNLYGTFAGYTSATVHTAFYVSSGATLLNIRDNIFVNSFDNTTSTTDKSYSIYSAGVNTAFTDINYCDYYVSGTPGILGYLGADKLTLTDWKTATGKDLNSISGNPIFLSDSNLHIDPYQISPVGDAGQFITGITDDIDGNTRSTSTPDIGADEYIYIPPVPAAPTLVTPLDNSTGNPVNLSLVWNKTQYSSKFNVLLATDAGFTNVVLNDSTLTDSIKALTNLNPLTTYYWKVRAGNIGGWSSFSSAFNFKTIGSPTQVVLSSPANNAIGQPTSITFKWFKAIDQTDNIELNKNSLVDSDGPKVVSNYWFELSTDSNFVTGVTRDSLLTDTTKALTSLSTGTTYYWRVKAKNQIGWGGFSSKFKFSTIVPTLSLNLKVYLEGFWNGTNQVTDTVMVYLASATTPYAYVDTAKVVLSATGQASMNFNRVSTGSYYIVVNHRNHLETWSKLPQSFVGGTPLSYDFTTAMTQAYGDNMKQVGSVWVLIGGDANRDGSIDAGDIGIFVVEFGTLGYLRSDFNGDEDVNAADVSIIANNFGLIKITPGVEPLSPEVLRNKKMMIENAFKNKIDNKKNN